MKKRFFAAAVLLLLVCVCMPVSGSSDSVAGDALVEGITAYQKEDWATALFFLRKAAALPEGNTSDVWYLLIMSEMFSGDYTSAIEDCSLFLNEFSENIYKPYVLYQQGRALHFTGKNQEAAEVFAQFCGMYPSHELYSSALFWLAEAFYAEYNYEPAKALYERIVTEFYRESKALDAQYRLETIEQREREHKLLYLLKVTGEEYLAAKENYARQLRQYQSEELISLRQQLKEMETQLAATEQELQRVRSEYAQSETKIKTLEARNQELQTAAQYTLSAADTALEVNEDDNGSADFDTELKSQTEDAGTQDVLPGKTEVSALNELRIRVEELRSLLDSGIEKNTSESELEVHE